MKKKMSKPERIAHEEKYIAFLEKAMASENWQKIATPELKEKTQEKLKKAKFLLKTLKM